MKAPATENQPVRDRNLQLEATMPQVGRKITPIKWWAAVGVISLGCWAVLWTAWVGSGDFKATPRGPTPTPSWMIFQVRLWEVIIAGVAIFCLYRFLIRPWRRERRVTLDGLICLAIITPCWQDMWSNSFRIGFIYNSHFLQFGSWANFLPGWLIPRGNLFSVPFIWEFGNYIAVSFPGILFANFMMRKAKTRWPQIGNFGLLMIAAGLLLAVDLILEPPWLRLGLYSYPSTIGWLTLWKGHYYQYPLTEGLFMTVWWIPMVALRYFRNDKGETFVERGLDRLRLSPGRKTGVRFLALAGFFNVALLVCFNIPVGMLNMVGDPWPRDIVNRSYMTNGICGAGTVHECPNKEYRLQR